MHAWQFRKHYENNIDGSISSWQYFFLFGDWGGGFKYYFLYTRILGKMMQ